MKKIYKNKNIKFYKVVGTENDFVVVPGPHGILKKEIPDFVRSICHRHNGVGADGVVFLKGADGHYQWDFYNCDGSSAQMCGNAMRGVAALIYTHLEKKPGKQIEVKTKPFNVKAEKTKGGQYKIYLPKPKVISAPCHLPIVEVSGNVINSGVPHFVIPTKNMNLWVEDISLMKRIQSHSMFGKEQTNVTLYQETAKGKIKAVTFERGVKAFTKACGTGALAAAKGYLLDTNKGKESRVQVSMPGGQLEVGFDKKSIYLLGPASVVFRGEWLWS